ncbi:MAG: ribonuclease H-like domain-containing protein, partial [Candidatus Margulisbacteria bacterium]|nr:ribonuclease H-like domain-containing protein [Candidatus Margulisiibacteriota bacterium]
MTQDITQDPLYIKLSQEYKFLKRAQEKPSAGPLASLQFVIFDLETTGLHPTTNEITEIGAFKVKGAELINIFSQLIKPKNLISPEITRLTGIDNYIVKDAPPIEQVLPKFLDYIGDSILIAHNAEFDTSFIKEKIKQVTPGKGLTNPILCTVKLSRYLLPNLVNHKLHTIGQHFGFSIQNRHRSIGDVELTFQIWGKFFKIMQDKGICD